MFANLKWFHCEALIWIDLYEWNCKFSHTYFICISPSVHFLFITFVQLDCWAFLDFFFFFFLIVFKAIIYFFLATMGLRCSASSFSSCSERELLSLWCLASEADSYPVPPGKSFSISETHETLSGWPLCDLGCKHSPSLSLGFPVCCFCISLYQPFLLWLLDFEPWLKRLLQGALYGVLGAW